MANLPSALLNSLKHIKGFDEAAFFAVHDNAEQIASIRLNTSKKSEIANPKSKIPWSLQGYYLKIRPSFTLDPLFHAGAYYVQEASSMFLQQVLQQTVNLSQPIKILDLCAAPGGKSTLIQSLISEDSLLVSNEVIKTRVNILSENITKWGAANVVVTNNDPKDFRRLQNYFDVIVIDAPCSGSGLFRKDAAAIEEWSLNNVQLCSKRQQRILADIMPSLKENGVLIYSTCSYSKEEDEDICDWIVKEFKVESLKLKVEDSWNIIETESEINKAYGYRFYPDKLKGEGFFIAAFINRQQATANNQSEKRKHEKLSSKEIAVLQPWLKNAGDFFFIKQNEEIIAMPIHLQDDLAAIQSSLYIKKAGVKMGAIIRDELIPHHELAVSTIINPAITWIDVDLETALQYLRKQEIKIDTVIKGWALIKHQQLPLGWVKILPARVNNYYPKEWRILNK
jgi:16S rRNA C967 or C1407 C5-methylase (RsmB/RsmF family)/NOL1/NOP2/fmu family ribosome biogenesis protein